MKRFNHRGHKGTQRNTTVGSTEVTGTEDFRFLISDCRLKTSERIVDFNLQSTI